MRRFILITIFFLSPLTLMAGKTSICRVHLHPSPYLSLVKEILRTAIISAQEFNQVEFLSAKRSLNSADIEVAYQATDQQFTIQIPSSLEKESPRTWKKLSSLEGEMTQDIMDHLTQRITDHNKSEKEMASVFLGSLNWKRLKEKKPPEIEVRPHFSNSANTSVRWDAFRTTRDHFLLTISPFLLGLILALGLGRSVYENTVLRVLIENIGSIFTTIPSLALFCLVVPFYGMSVKAIFGVLLLYNVFILTNEINQHSATASPNRLSLFKSHYFISKMRELVVLDVSLVTVAGFFIPRGFGNVISLALTIYDLPLLMRGALGATLMAVGVKWTFETWEWWLTR